MQIVKRVAELAERYEVKIIVSAASYRGCHRSESA